jgi:outer membrane usher protein FimD/PapC
MSIDHNGVDKSGGLQIKAGDNITGLRLIAAYGTGTIRGSIRTEGGALPENTYVDVSFFRPGNAQPVKYQQVDARGRFVFERVPPGNYELRATVYLNNKQVTTKQSVVASNGTVTEVTLTVDLNEAPIPKP